MAGLVQWVASKPRQWAVHGDRPLLEFLPSLLADTGVNLPLAETPERMRMRRDTDSGRGFRVYVAGSKHSKH